MERLLEALKMGDGSNKRPTQRLFGLLADRLSSLDAPGILDILSVGFVPQAPQAHGDLDSFLLLLDHLLSSDRPSVKEATELSITTHETFLLGLKRFKSVAAAEAVLRWADRRLLRPTQEQRDSLTAVLNDTREAEATRQTRKTFIEHIERDRERLRGLKELDWQRVEGEGRMAECDEYIDKIKTVDEYEMRCVQLELDVFHAVDTLEARALEARTPEQRTLEPHKKLKRSKPQDTIVIVSLPEFDTIPTGNKELMRIVGELAKVAYFYRHLHDFNQPHVHYYADEDDRADLRYDFDNDDLAKRPSSRSHFLRERAYRMRKCSQRFDEDRQRAADRLEKEELRLFYRVSSAGSGKEVVEAGRVVDQLVGRGFVVIVACKLHMSYILALFALLNPRRLTSHSFYSLAEKPLEYVVQRQTEEHPGMEVTVVHSISEIKSLLP